MIVNTIKTNKIAQLVLLFIGIVLLWGRNLIHPVTPTTIQPNTLLYPYLFGWLDNYTFLSTLLGLLCLLFQTYILYEMINTHKLSKSPLFIALIYFLLMSIYPPCLTLNPYLLANTFLIGSLNALFKVYDIKEPYQHVLNASSLLALASFFWTPLTGLFLALLATFIFYAINKWREWVLSFLGFLFPYILLWAILYLKNEMDFFQTLMKDNFQEILNLSSFHTMEMPIFFVGIILFMTISVFFTISHIKAIKIFQRKKVITMILFSFMMIPISSLHGNSLAMLSAFYVYTAYMIAQWILKLNNKTVAEISFILFILFILSSNFFYFINFSYL